MALFTEADDWQNNAWLDTLRPSDLWQLFAWGYKEAADQLVLDA
jgi:hypothetical protein